MTVNSPIISCLGEVHETKDINEVAAMLNDGWIAVAAAPGKPGEYLWCLGKVDLRRVAQRLQPHPIVRKQTVLSDQENTENKPHDSRSVQQRPQEESSSAQSN